MEWAPRELPLFHTSTLVHESWLLKSTRERAGPWTRVQVEACSVTSRPLLEGREGVRRDGGVCCFRFGQVYFFSS